MWFLPSLMIAGSLALALGLVELDLIVKRDWLLDYPLVFGVGTDGSRGMLTAIASSMLTVATLAFSLTLNAVTQASGQFTPRIFRNFLRDRANQFVLGYFVSVFAYCLVVLRTIRSGDEGESFVPSLAVVTGLLLALGGIFVLIFFIHHIAKSLQINQIVDSIVDETKAAIDSLFPSEMGRPAGGRGRDEAVPELDGGNWTELPAASHGYLQRVDTDGLMEFASENKTVVRLECSIGEFVGTGKPLASVLYKTATGNELNGANIDKLQDLFELQRHRTIDQDVGFGIRQLVDIALKALSPGVNDTTTAVTCIDNLGEIIATLAGRQFPSRIRRANDGGALIIVRTPRFEDYVETAFDQIRISGKGNMAVFMRLIDALSFTASRTDELSRRQCLIEQIELTAEFAGKTLSTEYEKEKVSRRIADVKGRIKHRQTADDDGP